MIINLVELNFIIHLLYRQCWDNCIILILHKQTIRCSEKTVLTYHRKSNDMKGIQKSTSIVLIMQNKANYVVKRLGTIRGIISLMKYLNVQE